MNVQKIGVIGSFAAGAAFALAPLASATPTPDDSFDFNSVLLSEVQTMNSIFESQAAMAGVDVDDIVKGDPTATAPLSFDTISTDKVNDSFASLLYGFNPDDNAASDPGSYVIFNGAATEFVNGFNVELYSLLNGGDLIAPDSLFGSASTIAEALADGNTASDAANVFFDAGFNDMLGSFDVPSIDV